MGPTGNLLVTPGSPFGSAADDPWEPLGIPWEPLWEFLLCEFASWSHPPLGAPLGMPMWQQSPGSDTTTSKEGKKTQRLLDRRSRSNASRTRQDGTLDSMRKSQSEFQENQGAVK